MAVATGWAPADGVERFLAATESLLTMAGNHRRHSRSGSSSADSSRHGAKAFAALVVNGAGDDADANTAQQKASGPHRHGSAAAGRQEHNGSPSRQGGGRAAADEVAASHDA